MAADAEDESSDIGADTVSPSEPTQTESIVNGDSHGGEVTPFVLGPRDELFATFVESRVTARVEHIFREEIEPYGGLPSPETLGELARLFPDLDLPRRLIERVEREQVHRHEMEREGSQIERLDVENDSYIAETDRLQLQTSSTQQSSGRRYAFAAFVLMLAAGVTALVLGNTAVAVVVLGTSIAGVVGAFLLVTRRGDSSETD